MPYFGDTYTTHTKTPRLVPRAGERGARRDIEAIRESMTIGSVYACKVRTGEGYVYRKRKLIDKTQNFGVFEGAHGIKYCLSWFSIAKEQGVKFGA